MGYDFDFNRTFEVGCIYLEAKVTCEYSPATESTGPGVELITVEAEDPKVEEEVAGLWCSIVKWLMDKYHDTLEAEGMRHAMLQGLDKFDYRMPPRTKGYEIRRAG